MFADFTRCCCRFRPPDYCGSSTEHVTQFVPRSVFTQSRPLPDEIQRLALRTVSDVGRGQRRAATMALPADLCPVQVSCFRLTDSTPCYLPNARHELKKRVGLMQSRKFTSIRRLRNLNQVIEAAALTAARSARVDVTKREHVGFCRLCKVASLSKSCRRRATANGRERPATLHSQRLLTLTTACHELRRR